MIHACFGVSENCINHYSYGEICVHCGCCEDIEPNEEKRLNNQIEYYFECIEENNNFSNWNSNEAWRKVQEENIKENNIYYAKKIKEIKKQLEQLKTGHIADADKMIETETWNSMHGKVVMPKGTFDKLYELANQNKEQDNDQ